MPLPDASGSEQLWREDRIDALLAEHLAEHSEGALFISGTVSNQGKFYPKFDAIVLLSAPLEVILERVASRETNDYGKTDAEREEIVHYVAAVEPLLRATATAEIDTRKPLDEVANELESIVNAVRQSRHDPSLRMPAVYPSWLNRRECVRPESLGRAVPSKDGAGPGVDAVRDGVEVVLAGQYPPCRRDRRRELLRRVAWTSDALASVGSSSRSDAVGIRQGTLIATVAECAASGRSGQRHVELWVRRPRKSSAGKRSRRTTSEGVINLCCVCAHPHSAAGRAPATTPLNHAYDHQ